MSWVWALLGFAALIVLHEAGHFVAAKAVGMRVERFSLFFGPMFVKRQIGETLYGVGVIPLGGYVKITGMSPEEVFEEPSVQARAYVNQPVWKRIVVIAAGPAVNLLIALVIFTAIYHHEGSGVLARGSTIEKVEPHSAAAGQLQAGDQIVSIDARTYASGYSPAIDASTCAGGAKTDGCVASPAVSIVVRRDGRELTYHLHPRYSTATKTQAAGNLIGFKFKPNFRAISYGSAAHYGVKQMWTEVSGTVSALGHLYQSKDRKQLHSIAGIATITEQETSMGAINGLFVIAGVSLALAVFNLLPLLPLDGGHIFWALMEKLRRGRKISLATMERASYVGLALMLCLVAIGFSNDISTFVHGGHFIPRR
jgi:regulator of sigma E protease